MSDIRKRILFLGSDNCESHEIEVFCNDDSELFIQIDDGCNTSYITLNKETAIEFMKELQLEIDLL